MTPKRDWITVVSGLPRSGTSLMMRMLQTGGMQVLMDGARRADDDNPEGYYEYERVKKLPAGDGEWLEQAVGRAVKIISALVRYLPVHHEYRVIMMSRDMEEILASQNKMLARSRQNRGAATDARLAKAYGRHLHEVEAWLRSQRNIRYIWISYNRLLTAPLEVIAEIDHFLEYSLDTAKMDSVINPHLYRQRSRR